MEIFYNSKINILDFKDRKSAVVITYKIIEFEGKKPNAEIYADAVFCYSQDDDYKNDLSMGNINKLRSILGIGIFVSKKKFNKSMNKLIGSDLKVNIKFENGNFYISKLISKFR